MTEPTLKDKVEELIRENKVLLFMKGNPEAPQCGFSMRVVNVLEPTGSSTARSTSCRRSSLCAR